MRSQATHKSQVRYKIPAKSRRNFGLGLDPFDADSASIANVSRGLALSTRNRRRQRRLDTPASGLEAISQKHRRREIRVMSRSSRPGPTRCCRIRADSTGTPAIPVARQPSRPMHGQ